MKKQSNFSLLFGCIPDHDFSEENVMEMMNSTLNLQFYLETGVFQRNVCDQRIFFVTESFIPRAVYPRKSSVNPNSKPAEMATDMIFHSNIWEIHVSYVQVIVKVYLKIAVSVIQFSRHSASSNTDGARQSDGNGRPA